MLIKPSIVELLLLANLTIVRIRESSKKKSECLFGVRTRGTSGRRRIRIATRVGQSGRESIGRTGGSSQAHFRHRERRQPVEPGAAACALGIGARSAARGAVAISRWHF